MPRAAAAVAAAPLPISASLPAATAALPAGAAPPLALVPALPAAHLILCRAGCGRSFASQQAEIAHLRRCPRRQARPGSEPSTN
jgi:hypothetical protein